MIAIVFVEYGAGTLNTVPFQGTEIYKPDMFNLNHSPPQHKNQKSGNIINL
jgi:hypothetical protein